MRKEVIGDCTLYLGDCRDILPTLGEIDALVTDPPYGIKEAAGKNKSRGKIAKATDYGDKAWDDSTADDAIELARTITQWQIIFGGNYYVLPPTSCWLVWDKKNGANDFSDCELAWTNLKKAVRRIEYLWNGMIRKGDDVRVHPTQKPLEVMKWCIGHLPSDTTSIVDPFMGSGTTLVACAEMGLRGVGIEQDEDYFEAAIKRVKQAYNQGDLFYG